jgi:aspartyl/asparaginyl beta-hydroxylase (cupin superfamily)
LPRQDAPFSGLAVNGAVGKFSLKSENGASMQTLTLSTATARRPRWLGYATRALKRVLAMSLGIYFIPRILAFYFCCGLLDVMRNKRRTLSTVDRYFFGNGLFTWLLSPFNLLIDLICLPYRNKGIYRITDLPKPYQEEIDKVIAAAHHRNIVEALESKVEGQKRGMIFFKWYGKNVDASVAVPEFHEPYKFIRTIGVSIFNKKQSTTKHYGPLRVSLRVLYNINNIESRNVFIKVGSHTHYWRDEKLFIFDDTLQHKSCNDSEAVRYCLFVDILRPSSCPRVLSSILTGVRALMSRFHAMFYQHWTFLK